ncbi:MAG: glycerophosphodiester phosphodiesterase family protein [Pseudomonadota bacterium]|nr:glycerophosphodiester phosphodiesterase family protein [Pseudomonadota bacterium]
MERLTGIKNPLIIAHRGASSKAPENTILAYETAWLQNADAIEVDLRKTKDGVFICAHDNNFNRVSGSTKNISESTFKSLLNIDIGSWKGQKFKTQRVPKLEDVLKRLPNRKIIFIEIKGVTKSLNQLMKLISNSNLKKNQVHFLCYLPSVIKNIKKKFPTQKATLNLIPSLFDYDEERIKEEIKNSNSDGISLHVDSKQSIKLIEKLKNEKFFVLTWTVNDKKFMKKLIQSKVDGIITDYPKKLAKILERINEQG